MLGIGFITPSDNKSQRQRISLENSTNQLINETRDKNYVLELKADINKSQTFLRNNFEFPRTRFSKYDRAVDSLIDVILNIFTLIKSKYIVI